MKNTSAILLFVLANCLPSSGQTTARPVPPEWLLAPSLQLRPLAPESAAAPKASPFPPGGLSLHAFSAPRPDPRSEWMALISHATEFDFQMQRTLKENHYLGWTEPLPERNPVDAFFSRSLNTIFEPEVIRFRKTELSCSIVTAIKRKNPLCLLNPIFLHLSW